MNRRGLRIHCQCRRRNLSVWVELCSTWVLMLWKCHSKQSLRWLFWSGNALASLVTTCHHHHTPKNSSLNEKFYPAQHLHEVKSCGNKDSIVKMPLDDWDHSVRLFLSKWSRWCRHLGYLQSIHWFRSARSSAEGRVSNSKSWNSTSHHIFTRRWAASARLLSRPPLQSSDSEGLGFRAKGIRKYCKVRKLGFLRLNCVG